MNLLPPDELNIRGFESSDYLCFWFKREIKL
jgi:hypothetical protein